MNMGQGTEQDEAYWLVKSGDRILGPFGREEIKAKLYEKEIVVIDEVTTPMRRWRYIRDEPAFAVVVEEIRKANLGSREDTELGTFTSATQTMSQTAEMLSDESTTSGTITPPPEPPMVKDAEIVEENQSQATRLSPPSAGRAYGYSQDRRVRQDLDRGARMMWVTAFVILLGAGFLFMRLQTETGKGDPATNLFKLVNEAQMARKLGDFRHAADIYKRLAEAGYTDPDMMIDMAALLLRTGDYSVSPTRILDTVQKGSLISARPETRAKLETVRGLMYLVEASRENAPAQIKMAREAFDDALRHDPGYPAAVFNRAMTSFLDPRFRELPKEDVQELAATFESLNSSSKADPSIRSAAKIMASLTFLKSRQPFYVGQAARALDTYRSANAQYWQEASFLRIYAMYLENNITKAQTDLRLVLGSDPFVTGEHFVEPMIYAEPLRWSSLLEICEELYRGINTPHAISKRVPPEPEALLQYCRFQAELRPETAREKMKELERKNPSDARIRALSAYMIMSLNPEDAKAKVEAATDDQEWDLGRVLKGRLCERQDYKCLSESLPKVTTVTPPPLYFRVGAARYHFELAREARKAGDSEAFETHMRRARENLDIVERISPHYLPFLSVSVDSDGNS